jgi:hypothetical protein
MFVKIPNPKSDLINQATEDHPMVMFSSIVAAAFIWTLMPGEPAATQPTAMSAPAKVIPETKTTAKTSRLPMSDVDHACQGQSWGGESIECLKMIARESGRTDLKVRMIADAAPADIDTPNIF